MKFSKWGALEAINRSSKYWLLENLLIKNTKHSSIIQVIYKIDAYYSRGNKKVCGESNHGDGMDLDGTLH